MCHTEWLAVRDPYLLSRAVPAASDLARLIRSERRDMFQEGRREDVVSLKGFKKVNPFPKHRVPQYLISGGN